MKDAKMVAIFLSVFMVVMGAERANGSETQVVDLQRSSAELEVWSLNIQGLPISIVLDHNRYRVIGEWLHELRKSGRGPQIVALQEAFHDRTEELIAAAGYPYVEHGPSDKGFETRSGLVILSVFPIKVIGRPVFENCVGVDCLAQKGVLSVRVWIPGAPEPLEIHNLHLNAGPNSVDCFKTEEEAAIVRMLQVGEIFGAMKDRLLAHVPTIVVGDFNFPVWSKEHLLFVMATGMKNAAQILSRSRFGRRLLSVGIDHQFYVSGARLRIVPVLVGKILGMKEEMKGLSDHEGVRVIYEVFW